MIDKKRPIIIITKISTSKNLEKGQFAKLSPPKMRNFSHSEI